SAPAAQPAAYCCRSAGRERGTVTVRALLLVVALWMCALLHGAGEASEATSRTTLKVSPSIKLVPATQLKSPASTQPDKPLTQQLDAERATNGRTLAPVTGQQTTPASSASPPEQSTTTPDNIPGTPAAAKVPDRTTPLDTPAATATPTSSGSLLG